MTVLTHEALRHVDPEIADILNAECQRQQEGLELIASENFTSIAVMQACGSVLTNKYAEGLPGKRYYGGCEVVDRAEVLAIERAKKLFQVSDACPIHVNVQPHSGAQANMAAFLACGLKPGDTVLGMNLSHGGHLTHGSPVNFSGLTYNIIPYGVDADTGLIDYDAMEALAREHRPKLIICGASAYARTLDFARFRAVADAVGAFLMADIAHVAGLVVTGHHPSPFPHAHVVTTTTHKTLRGPRGGLVMAQCGEFYGIDLAKGIDKAVFPGLQGGPLMHIIAGKAVALLEAQSPQFKAYSQQVVANAQAMAQALLAGGIPLISGGTDNHLLICDLRTLNLTGKEAQHRLQVVDITANKNTIPNDPQSPFVTSGLRLGSPALTTRGFTTEAFAQVGALVADLCKAPASAFDADSDVVATWREQVHELARQFPLYPSGIRF